ncbi:hypothetical protein [Williamsia muralis]|uniref:Uncharacterized protein n=1 Tax=Williamsia marianensis TaxID=85044 RepID=A0ABU4F0Y0_WILMA|nr:hypothetical protein [Williamsia muralis]MDV7137165.1 hypothetical protein [Williamsia muralis]
MNVAESSLEEARQRSERDQVIALNRHSAEAVADLWAAILAIRRPFDGFAAEARKSGAFGANGPSASVERLADELQEKLASAEAALFYARAVLPEGTVLHQTQEVDARFAELRDSFEAGSNADQSVFDWLGTLTEKLEEVLTFKDLMLKLVRFHFPMNWAEIERVRIDEERRGEQLGIDTYIRGKAWHYRIPYRFAPRRSWREMGNESSQHLDGEQPR